MKRITNLMVEERRAFISEHLNQDFEVIYMNSKCYLYLKGYPLAFGTKKEVFEAMRLICIGSAFESDISLPMFE